MDVTHDLRMQQQLHDGCRAYCIRYLAFSRGIDLDTATNSSHSVPIPVGLNFLFLNFDSKI